MWEVDEAAGALVTVFTAEVHLTETSTSEVFTGTVCELGIALTACGKTHTHAQSWPYTLLSIMHTEPERNLPAVTYVSRPVGSQWCSQVTCSRLAHSAHSSPPLCDAKSMKDTQKAFHALGRTKPEGTDVFHSTTTIVIIIVDSTNTILHYSHVFVKFL